jgi:NTP pyrophosphatase (non-canonical NTP hydrolase)
MNELERLGMSDFFSCVRGAISHAVTKHPDFAKTPYQAISIITEELGELAQAVNDGNKEQAKLELFHVIATCARLYHQYLYLEELEENARKQLNGNRV